MVGDRLMLMAPGKILLDLLRHAINKRPLLHEMVQSQFKQQ